MGEQFERDIADGRALVEASRRDGAVGLVQIISERDEARAELSELRKVTERLVEALDYGLDLSDDAALEGAEPGGMVSCTRPVETWWQVREALARASSSLKERERNEQGTTRLVGTGCRGTQDGRGFG